MADSLENLSLSHLVAKRDLCNAEIRRAKKHLHDLTWGLEKVLKELDSRGKTDVK